MDTIDFVLLLCCFSCYNNRKACKAQTKRYRVEASNYPKSNRREFAGFLYFIT